MANPIAFIMGIVKPVLGLVGAATGLSDPIKGITDTIERVALAKENTKSEPARMAHESHMKALEARLAVIQVTSNSLPWRLARFLLTLPVIILMAKLLAYDRALGQWTGGHTDSLSWQEWSYIGTIVGGYFVDRIKTESNVRKRLN